MKKTILFGDSESTQDPLLLDLNALYHPPKQPLTALGIVSALVPLFGFGWQAMTQDSRTQLQHEIAKRINKRRSDEANLILILQLAAMFDCRELEVILPYALSDQQLTAIRTRLPLWLLTPEPARLLAHLPASSSVSRQA
ncbi:hypothetical protein VAWG006_26280 [Aeromonas enteropelogenes]|uniref:Transporter n=1 Tax=Aeromonas sp. 19NY04SH05-1 TaxID=2920537 RepID=A0AAU6T5A2_9GAMM|nr:hypothetical protein VAWG006_26280 [Aeromonas enteropelogenes]BEE22537.1 hypothetical protein VAWG007_26320 [Aeromonas enteropelogenes]